MNLVMRTHQDFTNPVWNTDVAQRSRKRLLVHVGVRQDARAQDRAIGANNFKRIGVVIPARIQVGHGHVKAIGAGGRFRDTHIDHVRLPGPGHGSRKEGAHENKGRRNLPQTDHPTTSSPLIVRFFLPADTVTVSPSLIVPSKIIVASGFCTARWMMRFRGRAP